MRLRRFWTIAPWTPFTLGPIDQGGMPMGIEDSSTGRDGFSRRELWNRLLGRRSDDPDSIASQATVGTHAPPAKAKPSMLVMRPPGADDESTFLTKCTGCRDCISACPHGVLRLVGGTRFPHIASTPMVDLQQGPCRACPDRPCTAACQTGALRLDVRPKIAIAEVVTQDCLAWQGGFCSACAEQCPVPGALIRQAGRPTIDHDSCWGCGLCQYVCPAPTNAIRIMPQHNRVSGVSYE